MIWSQTCFCFKLQPVCRCLLIQINQLLKGCIEGSFQTEELKTSKCPLEWRNFEGYKWRTLSFFKIPCTDLICDMFSLWCKMMTDQRSIPKSYSATISIAIVSENDCGHQWIHICVNQLMTQSRLMNSPVEIKIKKLKNCINIAQ